MQPLNTLILIEYEEPTEKKTETGIYVPTMADAAIGFLRKGKVVAVNVKEEIVKVGDTVIFNKNAVAPVPGSKTQWFVRTEDLYAVS